MNRTAKRRWSTGTVVAASLVFGLLGGLLGRSRATAERRALPLSASSSASSAIAENGAAASDVRAGEEATRDAADWNFRWQAALSERSTPARTARLAALIEELAKTDPKQALALAAGQTDWRLRDLLRHAAVRGWAEVDPDAAAEWSLNVNTDHRRAVVEAMLQGAARNPAEGARVALKVCQADAERAGDYGQYAVAALTEEGAFDQAVRFGLDIGTDKFPFLAKAAAFQWARNQPAEALAALDKIEDPATRGLLRTEALAGWAWADARGLAEYAATLPAGERSAILAEALPRWIEKEPLAAAEWIKDAAGTAEADTGVRAMAHMQSLIAQKPAMAMELAGSLADPADRTHTMRAVFRQWAERDPAAARQFAATTSRPEDREILNSEWKDLHPDG